MQGAMQGNAEAPQSQRHTAGGGRTQWHSNAAQRYQIKRRRAKYAPRLRCTPFCHYPSIRAIVSADTRHLPKPMQPFWQSNTQWNPYNGQRIGEAANPGPGPERAIKFVVTNPTCIAKKTEDYLNLQSDIISASETAATWSAQRRFGQAMHRQGYKTLWSPPTRAIQPTLSGAEHLRGKASGVALISKYPIRRLHQPQLSEFETSSRLLKTVCQIGSTAIHIYIVYGVARSWTKQDAVPWTNSMLKHVADEIAANRMPSIIMGDFNSALQDLPAMKQLESIGCIDALTLHKARTGKALPPTCKGITNPDNAIFTRTLRAKSRTSGSAHTPSTPTISLASTSRCQHLASTHRPTTCHESGPTT